MGGERGRNRSWLSCTHSAAHKWSFHEDTADKERQKASLTWEWNSSSPSVSDSVTQNGFLMAAPLVNYEPLSLFLFPPGFILKTRRSCQGLWRFPSSLLWWNKIPCYAGKLTSPFFTWAVLSHGQDKGSQAWTATASPEICHVLFQTLLNLFCIPASQHATDDYLLKRLYMFVQYMYRPPSGNIVLKEGIWLPLEQLFYFQGDRGAVALSPQVIWDTGRLDTYLHLWCHYYQKDCFTQMGWGLHIMIGWTASAVLSQLPLPQKKMEAAEVDLSPRVEIWCALGKCWQSITLETVSNKTL